MDIRRGKNEFVTAVATRCKKSKKEVAEVLDAIEAELKAVVTAKDAVRLPGFIEIGYKLKPSRNARNPKTQEKIVTQPKDAEYARFFGDWHNTEEVKVEE